MYKGAVAMIGHSMARHNIVCFESQKKELARLSSLTLLDYKISKLAILSKLS